MERARMLAVTSSTSTRSVSIQSYAGMMLPGEMARGSSMWS